MSSSFFVTWLTLSSLLSLSDQPGAYTFDHDSTKRNKIIIIDSKKIKLKEIGSLPKVVKEASGLEFTDGKYLWTHNDGGVPALFCLDTVGNLVKTVHLNHPNRGWEDLTQDNEGNLYVGAFGNNKNDKRDLKIYKLHNPDSAQRPIDAAIISYGYSDQKAFPPPETRKNFDMDAFASWGNTLYLFTKNRTSPFDGYTKIYTLPQEPGKYSATAIDSIYLGKGPKIDYWVTGADISPDGKTLALLSHEYIWIVKGFTKNKFSDGRIYQLNLNHFSHKAGICFATNETLYIVDELEMDMLGGKLYSLSLKGLLKELY